MDYLKYIFVFSLVLFGLAQCKICDILSVKCMTKGSSKFYTHLADGFEGLTKPVDPLYTDEIEGELDNVKYTLTNVTWTGFRTCQVKKFGLDIQAVTYDHLFFCSQLTVSYNYEAKISEGSSEVIEKGTGSVNAVDYEMILRGTYGKTITGSDSVIHFFIVSQNLDSTVPKGELTVQTKSNNRNGNKGKFGEILNHICENKTDIDEKFFRSPIMDKFVELLMKNVDTVIRTMRPEAIFPKD